MFFQLYSNIRNIYMASSLRSHELVVHRDNPDNNEGTHFEFTIDNVTVSVMFLNFFLYRWHMLQCLPSLWKDPPIGVRYSHIVAQGTADVQERYVTPCNRIFSGTSVFKQTYMKGLIYTAISVWTVEMEARSIHQAYL